MDLLVLCFHKWYQSTRILSKWTASPMIHDTDIEALLDTLSPNARAMVLAMTATETWPCDDEKAVQKELSAFED